MELAHLINADVETSTAANQTLDSLLHLGLFKEFTDLLTEMDSLLVLTLWWLLLAVGTGINLLLHYVEECGKFSAKMI